MLYKRKRMKNEMIYPKYTLDYIRKCDNEEMKEKGMELWHDVILEQQRLTVCLENSRYWFLSVFIKDDGSSVKFSLDYEDAHDSHYEFTDEDTVRRRIYKDGDEKLYLHDVFRRYIAETDGNTLLSKIPVTARISF